MFDQKKVEPKRKRIEDNMLYTVQELDDSTKIGRDQSSIIEKNHQVALVEAKFEPREAKESSNMILEELQK